MKPEEFRTLLNRKDARVPAVVFFVGQDEYLCRDLIDRVKAKVLGNTDSLNALESWDGAEHTLADILASADQMSFGVSQKVLEVRNAESLLAEDEILESYLQNPSGGAVLLFRVEKLDMRRKSAKSIEKFSTVVTIADPYADQRDGEVRRLMDRFPRVKLEPEALACLRDWVDDDLGALSKELEKISVAYPDKALVETADIEGLVFRQQTQNVFELVDAIFQRDKKKAMDMLVRWMQDEGRSALEIFGLLRSQAEKLYLGAELLDSGKPLRTVCQTLRIPPYFADAFAAKARKAKTLRPGRFFSALHQSDRAIKTGLLADDTAAELLVWKVCSG